MVNDEIISIKNPIEDAKVDRCGKHQDYLETAQYLSHGKEGGGRGGGRILVMSQ